MAGKSSIIDIRMRLRDAKRFKDDLEKNKKATKSFGGTARKVGKNLAGMAAGFAGMAAAKEAVSTTTTLAKSTLGLHNALGLSVESASSWAAVAQVRGVEQKALSQSFGKVAKMAEAAKSGSAGATASFAKLGISQQELLRLNFDQLLGATADGLNGISNKTDQAAVAQQVFGRGWQTIAPILRGGSKEMDAQLGLAKKYGAMFGGKSVKSMQDFIQAQRESEFAMIGLQIAFATRIVPALTKVYSRLTKLIEGFRKLPGPVQKAIVAVAAIAGMSVVLGPVTSGVMALVTAFKALSLQAVILKIKTILLKVALIAFKIQLIATAIATKAWAAAQWLLNAALAMNPIVLVVAALVLLAAGFVLAYKKVGWFRHAVQAVWRWIKSNWPKLVMILGGPLGIAVVQIIKHWAKIKSSTLVAVNFVKDKFWGVIHFFKGMPSKIGHATKGLFDGIKNAFKSAINWVIKRWNDLEFGMDAKKIAGKTVVPGFHIGTPNIPELYKGGFISSGNYGSFTTGERGPELQTVTPSGIMVQPLNSISTASLASTGGNQNVITKVYLDRKQIAEAVGMTVRDRRARR